MPDAPMAVPEPDYGLISNSTDAERSEWHDKWHRENLGRPCEIEPDTPRAPSTRAGREDEFLDRLTACRQKPALFAFEALAEDAIDAYISARAEARRSLAEAVRALPSEWIDFESPAGGEAAVSRAAVLALITATPEPENTP